MPAKRILIAALGNTSRGDDGAGPAVLTALRERHKLPQNIDYIELTAGGMDLALKMAGYEEVVVVDAIRSAAPAGTVLELTPEEVTGNSLVPPETHALSLSAVIQLAELAGGAPRRVRVVGIAGKLFEWGAMSPEVLAALPKAAAAVAALVTESKSDDAPRPAFYRTPAGPEPDGGPNNEK